MKKIIKGKTYNTETSKKVCSYVVNDWTHELYQSKNGEYFSYIYKAYKYDHYLETLRLVSENEMRHMMERSGVMSGDRKVTVLNELKEWCDEENESLTVTGEGGFVTFDFGSWEVTVDIDDPEWVKMTPKGKSVFIQDDLDTIERIRDVDWLGRHYLGKVRREYLNERFGEC